MQLTYRGVSYTHRLNSIQLPSSSYTGVYRGKVFNISSLVRVVRHSSPVLKYRGVNYSYEKNSASTKGYKETCLLKSLTSFNNSQPNLLLH